jgi:hypothetical protein
MVSQTFAHNCRPKADSRRSSTPTNSVTVAVRNLLDHGIGEVNQMLDGRSVSVTTQAVGVHVEFTESGQAIWAVANPAHSTAMRPLPGSLRPGQ